MPPRKKKGKRKEAKLKDGAEEGEITFVPKKERRLQQRRKSYAKKRGSTKIVVRPLLLHRPEKCACMAIMRLRAVAAHLDLLTRNTSRSADEIRSDLFNHILRVNRVLLKIDRDVVTQDGLVNLQKHGDAMLARLGIPNPKRPAEVVDSVPVEVHRSSPTGQPHRSKRPRSHGDICQEIVDHGTAVTGAVGSAREFGIAAVIGFR